MANSLIPGCGFHHVAVRVSDWERSLRLYTQGLGFQVKIEWGEAPKRAAMLDVGDGNYLELFERETIAEPSGEPPIIHFCLRADDCEKAFEIAKKAGFQVNLEPKVPEPFTKLGLTTKIAFVQGPDGEIIEFFQSRDL